MNKACLLFCFFGTGMFCHVFCHAQTPAAPHPNNSLEPLSSSLSTSRGERQSDASVVMISRPRGLTETLTMDLCMVC